MLLPSQRELRFDRGLLTFAKNYLIPFANKSIFVCFLSFLGTTLECTEKASYVSDAGNDGTQLADIIPLEVTPITFTKHVVATVDGPAYVTVADVDGDQKLDLVVSSFGKIVNILDPPAGEVRVFSWGKDLTEWTQTDTLVSPAAGLKFPAHVTLADLDGDQDLDAIVPAGFLACMDTPCGALAWFENQEGRWVEHDIVKPGDKLFYHHAELVDWDGDGLQDIVTVGEYFMPGFPKAESEAEVQWFKGTKTAERFETQKRVMTQGGGSFPVLLDVDQDDDLDILSAEYFYNGAVDVSFAWIETLEKPTLDNPAGKWQRHVIDNQSGPSMMLAVLPDFYQDGVTRIVGANHTNTTSRPGEPASAVFVFDIPKPPDHLKEWPKTKISQTITSRADKAPSRMGAPGLFASGDIDGDGDLDLLVAGDGDAHVYWLEQSRPGTFVQHTLEDDFGQAGGTNIIDLDGDGKNELVVTSYEKNAIHVYSR